jgi:transcriptional regulator with XRE-family HTH domain
MSDKGERAQTLAECLRIALREAQPPMTQTELARRSGVRREYITNCLNGVSIPHPYNLVRLAAALDLFLQRVFLLAGYTDEAHPVFDAYDAMDYAYHRLMQAPQVPDAYHAVIDHAFSLVMEAKTSSEETEPSDEETVLQEITSPDTPKSMYDIYAEAEEWLRQGTSVPFLDRAGVVWKLSSLRRSDKYSRVPGHPIAEIVLDLLHTQSRDFSDDEIVAIFRTLLVMYRSERLHEHSPGQ